MGLLSKASNIDFSEKLAFSTFIKNHNIKTCAIYEIENNIFSISDSIGFDSFSIAASESTVDFWNGICSKTNVVVEFAKANDTLKPLLQFFSFDMQENLSFVNIYRNDNKILLIKNQNITSEIISDFLKVDYSTPYSTYTKITSLSENERIYKYEINLDNALNSYDGKTKKSLFNEISNRIICKYFENCAIRISESKIRFFKIANSDFDGNAIIKHIKINLTEVIDSNSNKIDISYTGASDSTNELELFMKVE